MNSVGIAMFGRITISITVLLFGCACSTDADNSRNINATKAPLPPWMKTTAATNFSGNESDINGTNGTPCSGDPSSGIESVAIIFCGCGVGIMGLLQCIYMVCNEDDNPKRLAMLGLGVKCNPFGKAMGHCLGRIKADVLHFLSYRRCSWQAGVFPVASTLCICLAILMHLAIGVLLLPLVIYGEFFIMVNISIEVAFANIIRIRSGTTFIQILPLIMQTGFVCIMALLFATLCLPILWMSMVMWVVFPNQDTLKPPSSLDDLQPYILPNLGWRFVQNGIATLPCAPDICEITGDTDADDHVVSGPTMSIWQLILTVGIFGPISAAFILVSAVFGFFFSQLYHILSNHLQHALVELHATRVSHANAAGMMVVVFAYLFFSQAALVVGAPFLLPGLLVYVVMSPTVLETVVGKTGDGIFGLLALMSLISKAVASNLVTMQFELHCRDELQEIREIATVLQCVNFLAYVCKNYIGLNTVPDGEKRPKARRLRYTTYFMWLLQIGCEYVVISAVIIVLALHKLGLGDFEGVLRSLDQPWLWMGCYITVLCLFVMSFCNAFWNWLENRAGAAAAAATAAAAAEAAAKTAESAAAAATAAAAAEAAAKTAESAERKRERKAASAAAAAAAATAEAAAKEVGPEGKALPAGWGRWDFEPLDVGFPTQGGGQLRTMSSIGCAEEHR